MSPNDYAIAITLTLVVVGFAALLLTGKCKSCLWPRDECTCSLSRRRARYAARARRRSQRRV